MRFLCLDMSMLLIHVKLFITGLNYLCTVVSQIAAESPGNRS